MFPDVNERSARLALLCQTLKKRLGAAARGSDYVLRKTPEAGGRDGTAFFARWTRIAPPGARPKEWFYANVLKEVLAGRFSGLGAIGSGGG